MPLVSLGEEREDSGYEIHALPGWQEFTIAGMDLLLNGKKIQALRRPAAGERPRVRGVLFGRGIG